MSHLPLIDVNQLTVSESWPLLISAVSSAHFIAIDLELSGLGRDRTKSALDTEERYKLQCDVASSYGILSMGVACFQWQHPSSSTLQTHCKVEAFNIWMLSQRSYTIDPSSAQFLMEHGFDFNKQFRHGLPYTPVHSVRQECSTKLREGCGHLPSLFAMILRTGCPLVVHNGLMDLLFLYSHLYAPLPPRLDVFMADLSEMFSGGMYDTKAIADLHLHQEASFLEYIFRKRQHHDLLAAQSNTIPHLKLVFADYADLERGESSCVELVSLLPPPLPPLEHLSQTQLCHTFTSYGYCHRRGCERSHDVLISIALEEHKLELAKAKRKRRRELQAQRKRRKILSGDGVDPTHIEHLDTQQKGETELWEEQKDSSELAESAVQQPGGEKKPVDTAHGELEEDRQPTDGQHEGEREAGIIWQRDDRGLCDHFECELTAAKEKFSQRRANNGGGGGVKLKPSFGHRAGFDAFMTGYSFASIAVSLRKATESSGLGGERDSGGPGGEGEGNGLVGEREHRLLDELREMRNKLANRGKTFPLHILKSHFTNTSQPHRTAQLNIKEYFNKQWTNNHKKQCTNVQNTLSEI